MSGIVRCASISVSVSVLMLALVTTFGCAAQSRSDDVRVELEQLNRRIERLQESQQEIHARVDRLDEFAAQMAEAERGSDRPDPDKRYVVTIGNAPTKGPSSAAVKIVGWFDFQ
jgi:uncharacterized protein YlxW (UPF0749 family)